MNRGEFKALVDAATKSSAAQQAINYLMKYDLVSVSKGTAYRPYTRKEMAWIIFVACEGLNSSFQRAQRTARANPGIIDTIALALLTGQAVQVEWDRGGDMRWKLWLSADLMKRLAGSERAAA